MTHQVLPISSTMLLRLVVVKNEQVLLEKHFKQPQAIFIGKEKSNTFVVNDETVPTSLQLFRAHPTTYQLLIHDSIELCLACNHPQKPQSKKELKTYGFITEDKQEAFIALKPKTKGIIYLTKDIYILFQILAPSTATYIKPTTSKKTELLFRQPAAALLLVSCFLAYFFLDYTSFGQQYKQASLQSFYPLVEQLYSRACHSESLKVLKNTACMEQAQPSTPPAFIPKDDPHFAYKNLTSNIDASHEAALWQHCQEEIPFNTEAMLASDICLSPLNPEGRALLQQVLVTEPSSIAPSTTVLSNQEEIPFVEIKTFLIPDFLDPPLHTGAKTKHLTLAKNHHRHHHRSYITHMAQKHSEEAHPQKLAQRPAAAVVEMDSFVPPVIENVELPHLDLFEDKNNAVEITEGAAYINAEQIKLLLQKEMRSVEDCYEHLLPPEKRTAGKIVVQLLLLPTGQQEDVRIEENTLGQDQVAGCLLQRIKHWDFPKPRGGSSRLRLPFFFSPS